MCRELSPKAERQRVISEVTSLAGRKRDVATLPLLAF